MGFPHPIPGLTEMLHIGNRSSFDEGPSKEPLFMQSMETISDNRMCREYLAMSDL